MDQMPAPNDLSLLQTSKLKFNRRPKATTEQASILEDAFQRKLAPRGRFKKELAARLGITERSVQVWFQNRRAREKMLEKKRLGTLQMEKKGSGSTRSPNDLSSNSNNCSPTSALSSPCVSASNFSSLMSTPLSPVTSINSPRSSITASAFHSSSQSDIIPHFTPGLPQMTLSSNSVNLPIQFIPRLANEPIVPTMGQRVRASSIASIPSFDLGAISLQIGKFKKTNILNIELLSCSYNPIDCKFEWEYSQNGVSFKIEVDATPELIRNFTVNKINESTGRLSLTIFEDTASPNSHRLRYFIKSHLTGQLWLESFNFTTGSPDPLRSEPRGGQVHEIIMSMNHLENLVLPSISNDPILSRIQLDNQLIPLSSNVNTLPSSSMLPASSENMSHSQSNGAPQNQSGLMEQFISNLNHNDFTNFF